jgi:zinc protease
VLMRGNPYERPVSGAIEEIEKQVSEDAQAFYNTYYHPENAVAIVNGNLDLAELRALAENYFADIPRGPPHQRIPPAALPPQPAERLIELQSDAAAQTIVLQGYTGPGFGDGTNPEAYALDFLGVILASGTQGRLIKALVLDSKDALDVDVWFEGYRRHGGKLMIRAQLNKGADPLAVKKIIENEIANIITNGVSQAEIDDALNRDKISNVYQWDSNTALTNVLGTRAMLNWPIDRIFAFDGWNKITPAQVQGVAAKYLTVERGVTGILVPKAGSN